MYISAEGSALTEAEAIRNAVVQRIEFLDANFLAALNGYIEVTKREEQEGGGDLLPLLVMMRNEVLQQVALRLPPAARVLNRALQVRTRGCDEPPVVRTAAGRLPSRILAITQPDRESCPSERTGGR